MIEITYLPEDGDYMHKYHDSFTITYNKDLKKKNHDGNSSTIAQL